MLHVTWIYTHSPNVNSCSIHHAKSGYSRHGSGTSACQKTGDGCARAAKIGKITIASRSLGVDSGGSVPAFVDHSPIRSRAEPPQYVRSACERRGIHADAIVIAETIECWIYEAVLFVSIRCVFFPRILLLRVNN